MPDIVSAIDELYVNESKKQNQMSNMEYGEPSLLIQLSPDLFLSSPVIIHVYLNW